MRAAGAALLAALLFALATVLQHRSATRGPAARGVGLRLLGSLTRRPLWLLGGACGGGGLLLHAYALSAGRLGVVQPLLVTGMLFALLLDVVLDRRRARLGEVLGGAAVVLGLAVFLLAARAAPGSPTADRDVLLAATAAGLGLAGGLFALARPPVARHRAALLAGAAGTCFGVTGALLKQLVGQLAVAPVSWQAAWPAALLVAVGVLGLALVQSAYQAGPLAASLPPLTVVDPVVAVLIGALAFGEVPGSSALALLGQAGGLVLVTSGVRALAVLSGAPADGAGAPGSRPESPPAALAPAARP